MKIHLGCSDDLKKGWVNVDIARPRVVPEGIEFQRADLNNDWPWGDSSADAIAAFDVFEHISNLHVVPTSSMVLAQQWWSRTPGVRALLSDGAGNTVIECPGPIWCLNEAWRVLKPGGTLDVKVPAVALQDGRVNPGAWCDPTHRSFWHEDLRYYFCEPWNNPAGERGRLGPGMGIVSLFKPVTVRTMDYGEGVERRSKLCMILEAIK